MVSRIIFLIILNCINGVSSANVVVKVNENVTISCDGQIAETCPMWYYSKIGETTLSIIFNGENISKDFLDYISINNASGSCDLLIRSTMPSMAGAYECRKTVNKTRIAYRSELIVLESEPVCGANASSLSDSTVCIDQEDNAYVWCRVRFHGNWAPVMEWKQDGNHVTDGINGTREVQGSATFTMSKAIDFSDTNGRTVFSSKIYFANATVGNHSARNIPKYEFTWNVTFALLRDREMIYPSNVAVKKSENATITCKISRTCPLWYFYEREDSYEIIFNGNTMSAKFEDHFSVNTSTDSCDLLIRNASSHLAGKYECMWTVNSKSRKASAGLTVIESDPVCQTNASSSSNSSVHITEGDFIRIECNANYSGQWAPVMKCEQDGEPVTRGVNNFTKQNDSVTTIYIQKIHFDDTAQAEISCKTYFDGEKNHKIFSATNIPEYAYTWNVSIKRDDGGRNELNAHSTPAPSEDINKVILLLITILVVVVVIAVSTTVFCCFVVFKTHKDPLILNLDGISIRSRSLLDITLLNRSRLDLDACVQMRPDSDKPTERSQHYSSLSTSTDPDETYASVFNPDLSNSRGVLARPPMPLPNSTQPERDTTSTDKTAATGKEILDCLAVNLSTPHQFPEYTPVVKKNSSNCTTGPPNPPTNEFQRSKAKDIKSLEEVSQDQSEPQQGEANKDKGKDSDEDKNKDNQNKQHENVVEYAVLEEDATVYPLTSLDTPQSAIPRCSGYEDYNSPTAPETQTSIPRYSTYEPIDIK